MPKVDNAIVMAAGKGERLRPLTLSTPKPLLSIHGKPMIEQLIETLLSKDITDITVVVGYKKEQFSYLADKYGVRLIDNPDYEKANNISSLYYARDQLKNTIILDGDQIIHNPEIIRTEFLYSGYCCRYNEGQSKEWLLALGNDNEILSCSRDGGEKGWELLSLSFWTEEDSALLKRLLEKEYRDNRRTNLYWDDTPVFLHRNRFRLYGYRIGPRDLTEIDNIDEYDQANKLTGGNKDEKAD